MQYCQLPVSTTTTPVGTVVSPSANCRLQHREITSLWGREQIAVGRCRHATLIIRTRSVHRAAATSKDVSSPMVLAAASKVHKCIIGTRSAGNNRAWEQAGKRRVIQKGRMQSARRCRTWHKRFVFGKVSSCEPLCRLCRRTRCHHQVFAATRPDRLHLNDHCAPRRSITSAEAVQEAAALSS